MEIKRSGSQPSAKGPAEWFSGTVRIDPLFDAPVPARAAGANDDDDPHRNPGEARWPAGGLAGTCHAGAVRRAVWRKLAPFSILGRAIC